MDDKHPLPAQDWDPTPQWLRHVFRAVVFLFGLIMLPGAWIAFDLPRGIACKYHGLCAPSSLLGSHAFKTLWPMLAIGVGCIWVAWRMKPKASRKR